jgi:hypothetical protein
VVLYSRRRCGLCDEAREVVLAARRVRPFRFHEVSIDGDDRLEGRYGLRVPVVEIDGEERFEYRVDARRLRVLLGAYPTRRSTSG